MSISELQRWDHFVHGLRLSYCVLHEPSQVLPSFSYSCWFFSSYTFIMGIIIRTFGLKYCLYAYNFIGRTDAEAEAPILWLPHAKSQLIGRPWCWERLKAGREGDDRGSWMPSPTQWIWVWASFRRWWRTEAWRAVVHGIAESDMTEWLNKNNHPQHTIFLIYGFSILHFGLWSALLNFFLKFIFPFFFNWSFWDLSLLN